MTDWWVPGDRWSHTEAPDWTEQGHLLATELECSTPPPAPPSVVGPTEPGPICPGLGGGVPSVRSRVLIDVCQPGPSCHGQGPAGLVKPQEQQPWLWLHRGAQARDLPGTPHWLSSHQPPHQGRGPYGEGDSWDLSKRQHSLDTGGGGGWGGRVVPRMAALAWGWGLHGSLSLPPSHLHAQPRLLSTHPSFLSNWDRDIAQPQFPHL